MRPTENIRKLIKEVLLNTNAEKDKEVLADVLDALEKSRTTQSAAYRPSIWRFIMKNNVTRLAAAVVVLAVLVGAYQLGGARVFAQTTKAVRTGLAGLREFISDMRTSKPERPSPAPSAEPSEPQTAAQGNRIFASVQVFSVQPGQQDLREFLETEGIELVPAGDGASTSYAKLGPEKAERFLELTGRVEGIERLSSPSLMMLEGQEGIIGILGTGKPDALALALAATVLDDSEAIQLSLSFLHGEDGFEIPSLHVSAGEAVLFRLSTAAPAQQKQNDQAQPDGQKIILVLLRTKVFPQSREKKERPSNIVRPGWFCPAFAMRLWRRVCL